MMNLMVKSRKELNDAMIYMQEKEYPYVAKVKSNGKLEIVKPQNAKDFYSILW